MYDAFFIKTYNYFQKLVHAYWYEAYFFSYFHPLLCTISFHTELHSNQLLAMDENHVSLFLTIPSEEK